MAGHLYRYRDAAGKVRDEQHRPVDEIASGCAGKAHQMKQMVTEGEIRSRRATVSMPTLAAFVAERHLPTPRQGAAGSVMTRFCATMCCLRLALTG